MFKNSSKKLLNLKSFHRFIKIKYCNKDIFRLLELIKKTYVCPALIVFQNTYTIPDNSTGIGQ